MSSPVDGIELAQCTSVASQTARLRTDENAVVRVGLLGVKRRTLIPAKENKTSAEDTPRVRIDVGAQRLEEQCPIALTERDRFLLVGDTWLADRQPSGWEADVSGATISRTLEMHGVNATENSPKTSELKETMLLFPNAPIIATHNAPPHRYFLPEHWPNCHTMRLLRREDKTDPGTRTRHVFLLHNGLNETGDMVFHYLLANWILEECEDAVCLIRPLPSHLTRYPFQGPFTERPLDEFLRDPGSVFRQYLRYMLETRWLLSALVPRPTYDVMTGCHLLLDGAGKKNPARTSRVDAGELATEIARQGNAMLAASAGRAEDEETKARVRSTDVREVAASPAQPLPGKLSLVGDRSRVIRRFTHVLSLALMATTKSASPATSSKPSLPVSQVAAGSSGRRGRKMGPQDLLFSVAAAVA